MKDNDENDISRVSTQWPPPPQNQREVDLVKANDRTRTQPSNFLGLLAGGGASFITFLGLMLAVNIFFPRKTPLTDQEAQVFFWTVSGVSLLLNTVIFVAVSRNKAFALSLVMGACLVIMGFYGVFMLLIGV